jgi:hypothetical protein
MVAAVGKVLDDGGANATWFLSAAAVRADPTVARLLADRGELTGLSADGLSNAAGLDSDVLGRAQKTFQETTGTCSGYLRPAHAWHTPISAAVARHNGMRLVAWETRFSKESSTVNGGRRVVNSIRPGTIVAFDLANPGTPEVVKQVLDYARERHLVPARLDQLLDETAGAC